MDLDLQNLICEAKNNGVRLDELLLFSIAVSVKRIADLLDESDTDRRIEIAAKMLSDV